MRLADAQNDIEEFIISQTAAMASKIEQVALAEAENAASLVENADAIELGEIRDIGECLFFDPCGPTAVYGGHVVNNWKKKRTSWRGEAIDPYNPKKLVEMLCSCGAGCAWMRAQWEELGAHLKKARGFWRSADKLRSIRLLARQPVDLADDVRVATIFLASHAIRRVGKPFDELLSDMSSEAHARLVKDVTDRWADEIDVSDATKARQLLVDLVEENIALIDKMLGGHEATATKKGEKSADRLGVDESPRSLHIEKRKSQYISTFVRGIEVYRKWRKQMDGKRAEGGGRRGEESRSLMERLDPPDFARAAPADFGASIPDSGLFAPGVEVGPEGWINADGRIDDSEVMACEGFLPERCIPRHSVEETLVPDTFEQSHSQSQMLRDATEPDACEEQPGLTDNTPGVDRAAAQGGLGWIGGWSTRRELGGGQRGCRRPHAWRARRVWRLCADELPGRDRLRRPALPKMAKKRRTNPPSTKRSLIHTIKLRLRLRRIPPVFEDLTSYERTHRRRAEGKGAQSQIRTSSGTSRRVRSGSRGWLRQSLPCTLRRD